MPFVSKAQQRWGNSPAGKRALGAKGVKEWNQATKGRKLPGRVMPKVVSDKKGKTMNFKGKKIYG